MTDLREEDIAILHAVRADNGTTDVHELTHALTLTRRQINYSIRKYLEPSGLVHVEEQDGFTTCDRHQQTRRFEAPKQVWLTDKGETSLSEYDHSDQYADMSREELVQTIHDLEERMNTLETAFQSFQKQVKKHLS